MIRHSEWRITIVLCGNRLCRDAGEAHMLELVEIENQILGKVNCHCPLNMCEVENLTHIYI